VQAKKLEKLRRIDEKPDNLSHNPRPLSHGAIDPSGPMSPHYRGFTITLGYTTVGRTPLDE